MNIFNSDSQRYNFKCRYNQNVDNIVFRYHNLYNIIIVSKLSNSYLLTKK